MVLAVVTPLPPSDLLSMDLAVINPASTRRSMDLAVINLARPIMDPAVQRYGLLDMDLALVTAPLMRALVGIRSQTALTRHQAPIAVIPRLARVVTLALDPALQVVLEPSLV